MKLFHEFFFGREVDLSYSSHTGAVAAILYNYREAWQMSLDLNQPADSREHWLRLKEHHAKELRSYASLGTFS